MKKKLRNIAVAGILLCASAPSAAALELPVKSINGHKYFYYEVRIGDNVASLANSLGISRDKIIRYNPAAADGVRNGMVLYFPYEEFAQAGAKSIRHEVKRGETLFGLSHRYGVTPDDIIALNPQTKNGLKSGETILIPVLEESADGATQPAHHPNETPLYVVEPRTNEKPAAAADTVAAEAVAAVVAEDTEEETDATESADEAQDASIAVVLPFALGEENTSRQSLIYTDFYKGLLLAAEKAAAKGSHIDIHVYDSTDFGIDGAMRSASVIIAPEDAAQMGRIAEAVADSAAYVINLFNLKDESYLTNPSIVQAYIPHTEMYAKAYQGMRERFGDTRPVILTNTGGRNDKAAYLDYIRERYTADGIVPVEISYSGTLRSSELDILDPAERYVIVPSSGSLNEFNKMSHALKAYRDDPATATIEVFGYPDWAAFRGDALDMLYALGATLYSRIYIDPAGDDSRALADAFVANYGTAPMEIVPNNGALGYDLGCMLIENLRANDGVFTPETDGGMWQGKQSAFRFIKAGDKGGYVNDTLYIVTFDKDKTTQCTVL